MPPRTVKRGGAAGPRRTARAVRGAAKQQAEVAEEAVKVEEVPVKEEEKAVVEDDNKPIVVEYEPKSDVNGSVPVTESKLSRFFFRLILIQVERDQIFFLTGLFGGGGW